MGAYRLVDAHCHVYPDKIATRAVAGTDTFYGLHSLYDGTVDTLLAVGDCVGIDHFVVQSVATTPKQVQSINEFIAKTVAAQPGRMTGLGTLHPESGDIAGDMRHIMELGLHGVKLHPDIQRFKIDDYRCLKIYELCEREGLPILMHTGDSRYDFSNPNRLLPVLKIYTGLTVVGAHLGGWSVWKEARETLAGLPNFYVDTCSSLPFLSVEEARETVRCYGADRVLFGTDYPMFSAEKELALLAKLELTEAEQQKILADNAVKVFRIGEKRNRSF